MTSSLPIRHPVTNRGPRAGARPGSRLSTRGVRQGRTPLDEFLSSPLRPVGAVLLLVGASVVDGVCAPPVGWVALLVAATAAATLAGAAVTGGVLLVLGAVDVSLALNGSGSACVSATNVAVKLLVCAIITVFCALRERHRMELTAVRAISELTQGVVLRPLPDQLGPLRIAATYQASDAHATVGGDLYAAARVPGATRILIGDVRGKGLEALHEVAAVVGAFREAARLCDSLPEVAAHLEGSIRVHLEEISEADDAGERFITAVVLEVPDDRRVVSTVNCGHPAPLVASRGRVTLLEPGRYCPPLGLGSLAPRDYHQDTFPFSADDVLMLYTDGITEARNSAGTFYPLEERVASWTGTDPGRLLRYVQADVSRHLGGPLGDDAAMVALRRSDLPRAGAVRPGAGSGAMSPFPPRTAATGKAASSFLPQSSGDGRADAGHHVLVVMFDGVQLLDVTGPLDVYAAANQHGGDYRLTTASPDGKPVRTTAGLRLVPDLALDDADFPIDTLVVPGGPEWRVPVADRALIDAIRRLAARSRTVAAVCAGAFPLAATGLLDGRRVATHWRLAAELAAGFPRIQVDSEAIFVREGRFVTSAGVTAGIDLTLSLVESDLGADVARAAAKYLVVFMARPGGQSQFAFRTHARVPRHSPPRDVTDGVVTDPGGNHGLRALEARAGGDPEQLTWLFPTETGSTTADFTGRLRVETAQALLEGGDDALEVVARRSGFGSQEAMRRAFGSHLGVSPGLYRARFRTTRPEAVPRRS